MRKIRIHTSSNLHEGAAVDLPEHSAKHLIKVLRKKEGEELYLFNENNGQWRCKITVIDRKNVRIEVLEFDCINNIESEIDLYFSPIKNPDATWIAQKATELGAKGIYPFLSARSVVKSVNLEKLQLAVTDATQQSERTDVPEIANAITFRELLGIKYDTVLFFDESGNGGLPSEISGHGRVAVIIGNEGGFTENEREGIYAIPNCTGISLPKLILRAETAVIAALTLAQNYAGQWRG